MALKLSVNKDIQTWKEYSTESHGGNGVDLQFKTLLNEMHEWHAELLPTAKCAHNHFENQAQFMNILRGYVRNEPESLRIVSKHRNNHSADYAITVGLCIDCIHQFILETKGLNDIFDQWPMRMYTKLWRSEFNNSNIIMIKQAIFLKCILLRSNMRCLSSIFETFFIYYLKETNLNQHILGHRYRYQTNRRVYSANNWRQNAQSDSYNFSIADPAINICHGLEHSICSLSESVYELVPFLKLHHIQHLFIDGPLRDIASIFDGFLEQYLQLPHLEIFLKSQSFEYHRSKVAEENKRKYEEWKKRISTDILFAKYWPHRAKNGEPVLITKQDHSVDYIIQHFYENSL